MKNSLKLTPWMILRRGHYLYHFYYWIYTWFCDRHLAGTTLSDTVFNDNPAAYPVQCISYNYIKELVKCINLTEDDVFVDVGCAWGRLLGYLHRHTSVGKLIGVELNSTIAETAEKIFAGYDDVQIISGDITENIPREATVFYLFNPFDESVMELFLKKIEEQFTCPVDILYLHPTCHQVFEQRKDRWMLTDIQYLKPRYLGKLALHTYRLTPLIYTDK